MDVVTLGAALSIMKKMPDTAASSAAAAEDAADRAEAAAEQAEGAIEVDDTLSVRGRAADAQAVGNKFTEVFTTACNAFPTDTASGSVASFADGADDIPMKSVVVNIEPVQSGSGDPSPTNVRPISGWTGAQVSHSGADTSDPTTYHITFPVEAGTVYGGELDVTNGTLTVDRAMVDLGTLSWALDDSRLKARIDNMANKAGRTVKMACSCFKALTNGEPYDASADLVCYGAYSYVYAHDFAYTDIAAFKTAVTGQQLAYELATPITYTLTPTEIKSLLGDNNVWADAGDTEVTYRADTKLYIDKKIAEVINALS